MKLLHTLKPIAAVVAGNSIVAFAIAVFILPKNLIAGGTTGLAIILNHFFGLNISLVVLIFNGFMFFVGAALLGKKFALTTILSTIIFPTFLTFFLRRIKRPNPSCLRTISRTNYHGSRIPHTPCSNEDCSRGIKTLRKSCEQFTCFPEISKKTTVGIG